MSRLITSIWLIAILSSCGGGMDEVNKSIEPDTVITFVHLSEIYYVSVDSMTYDDALFKVDSMGVEPVYVLGSHNLLQNRLFQSNTNVWLPRECSSDSTEVFHGDMGGYVVFCEDNSELFKIVVKL